MFESSTPSHFQAAENTGKTSIIKALAGICSRTFGALSGQKRTLKPCHFPVVFLLLSGSVHAADYVYIITGQSNACGRGEASMLSDHDKAMPSWIKYQANRNGHQTTSTWSSVNQWGVEIGLKNRLWTERYIYNQLHEPDSSDNVWIVKSCGIEPIHKWQPFSVEYARMMDTIVRARIPSDAIYKAVILIQGESDRGILDFALTWDARAGAAIEAWRSALRTPDLPVIYTMIGVDITPANYLYELRTSQSRLAETVGNVYPVDTSYITKSDGLHYTNPDDLAGKIWDVLKSLD